MLRNNFINVEMWRWCDLKKRNFSNKNRTNSQSFTIQLSIVFFFFAFSVLCVDRPLVNVDKPFFRWTNVDRSRFWQKSDTHFGMKRTKTNGHFSLERKLKCVSSVTREHKFGPQQAPPTPRRIDFVQFYDSKCNHINFIDTHFHSKFELLCT